MALFSAIIAVLKSSRATKNWIFTFRNENPPLLILMPCWVRANALLANSPG
jgi:hypothetical protein